MKIIRVLIYEGQERTVLAGLAARAVRDARILGNGILCHELFFADDDGDIQYAVVPGPTTRRLRQAIERLPTPARDTAHGDPPQEPT